MSFTEQCITIGLCALASVLTRALPFLLLSEKSRHRRSFATLATSSPPPSSECSSYTA